MSIFKFFKKGKSRDELEERIKREEEAEAEKRKLRHSLSISRSGRFKQRKRDRSGILGRPELYNSEPAEGDFKEQSGFSETSSSASNTSTNSNASTSTPTPSRRSPKPGYKTSQQGAGRPGNSMPT